MLFIIIVIISRSSGGGSKILAQMHETRPSNLQNSNKFNAFGIKCRHVPVRDLLPKR